MTVENVEELAYDILRKWGAFEKADPPAAPLPEPKDASVNKAPAQERTHFPAKRWWEFWKRPKPTAAANRAPSQPQPPPAQPPPPEMKRRPPVSQPPATTKLSSGIVEDARLRLRAGEDCNSVRNALLPRGLSLSETDEAVGRAMLAEEPVEITSSHGFMAQLLTGLPLGHADALDICRTLVPALREPPTATTQPPPSPSARAKDAASQLAADGPWRVIRAATPPEEQGTVRSTICFKCGASSSLPKATPPFGTALVCSQCHAPLVPVPENAGYPPRSVELFLGYRDCSLGHASCPSCGKINYAIVFPDNGYDLAWYCNTTPQNPNGFFIDTKCVHCATKFVVEWDDFPIKNKFCNYCSTLGIGIDFLLGLESGRQEFELNYGRAHQLPSPIKKGNGEAIWLICPPCMKSANSGRHRRLISAAKAFAKDELTRDRSLPAGVPLQQLVTGGYIEPSHTRWSRGIEVTIPLKDDNLDPHGPCIRLRNPDGITGALLADGSIRDWAEYSRTIDMLVAPDKGLGETTGGSCTECGAPETDRMEERCYQMTNSGAFAEYSCPGCKKKLTCQFEFRDKATGIQVLCGSCRTVAYIPPSVWCTICGKGLSIGWQKQISTGREADKAQREFTDPGVKSSRALARKLKAAHGKLKTINFKSPDQDYGIDFDFADGKRICSGANSGDIIGLAFGYCGGGPNRLQAFLDEMGLPISEDEIANIKPGTTAEVTGGSMRFVNAMEKSGKTALMKAASSGDVDGGGGAEALLAEVSRIEREQADLLASSTALAKAGLARIYAEIPDPHGAFVLGYVHGSGNAVARAAFAGAEGQVAFVLALFKKCLGEKEGATAWGASCRCFHAGQAEWEAGRGRGFAETSTLLSESTNR